MDFDKRLVDRFESRYDKVTESGCWIWIAGEQGAGYGCFYLAKHKPILAHRFSYLRYVGQIPEGTHVLHRCDVRCCVNPSHLFIGNAKTNADDREEKQRGNHAKGERNHSKLTADQVIELRMLRSDGWLLRELADKFSIHEGTASQIVRRKKWAHI